MKSALLVLLLVGSATAAAAAGDETSCTACHGDGDLFTPVEVQIVSDFAASVHAEVGLSCHDCHGGDPAIELAEDIEAMNPDFSLSPYVGAPDAVGIPEACGSCHSNATYMKRFRPDARSDQQALYETSHHGKALAAGDVNVAHCVSCHGSHDVRRVSDPDSPVYATRVAATCSECHSDATRMAAYSLPDGQPFPTDQYDLWRHSVHAAALYEREDLSAPTCNDCHGNHGAAPPGLGSISLVCGSCHGREAELFRASVKRQGFADHSEYLAEAGEEGCDACHESMGATLPRTAHGFAECATCHGNHGVLRPTLALLSPLPDTPCAFCHEAFGAAGMAIRELDSSFASYAARRSELLGEAQTLGLEGHARFDWLVTRARSLETHTVATGVASEPLQPRPEFSRLFEKFRIGRTVASFTDPDSDESFSVRTVRCSDCHGQEDDDANAESAAAEVARGLIGRMRELTGLTASAERTILAARRGGVEVREGLEAIDRAVDSQIQLEVLVHGFTIDEDSPFVAAYEEGVEHARAAVAAGIAAQEELAFRRRGLGWSLIFITILLVTLAIKIRRLP